MRRGDRDRREDQRQEGDRKREDRYRRGTEIGGGRTKEGTRHAEARELKGR